MSNLTRSAPKYLTTDTFGEHMRDARLFARHGKTAQAKESAKAALAVSEFYTDLTPALVARAEYIAAKGENPAGRN